MAKAIEFFFNQAKIIPVIGILICSILCLFIAWLSYNYDNKKLSFPSFYLAVYLLYFYVVITKSFTSPILVTYILYISVFFSYHWYKTFTRRFMLRCYSVVKAFWESNSIIKLTLWVLLILIPTLINDSFIFSLVFIQLLLLSLMSHHTTILFVLILILLWFCFLGISSYFNKFPKLRERILKYFSRRACLHFIGNAMGSKIAEFFGKNYMVILGGIATGSISIGIPLNEASTIAYKAGEAVCEEYKLTNPNATPQDLQKINDVAFHKSLKADPLASFFHRLSGGIICAPTPVDGNGIHYTDPHSVEQDRQDRLKLTTPNSNANNFAGLQHEDSEKLNCVKDATGVDKVVLKEKSEGFYMKPDDVPELGTKETSSESLHEWQFVNRGDLPKLTLKETLDKVADDWRRANPKG
jgi:hypothetical protein